MSVAPLFVLGHQLKKQNPVFLADCEEYMSQVQEALGAYYAVGYFEDVDLTPEFDYYADDAKGGFEGTHY